MPSVKPAMPPIKSLSITPEVHVAKDKEGRVRHLRHLQQPFVLPEAKDARELASAYLHAVAEVYGITEDWLGHLDRPPEGKLTDEPSRLAFADEKRVLNTRVCSFVQVHAGLPVWEGGLSVVVQERPLRVTNSQSSLHHGVELQRPTADAMDWVYRSMNEDVLKSVLEEFLQRSLPRTGSRGVRVNRDARNRPWQLFVYRYDAERRLDAHLESGAAAGEEWSNARLPKVPAGIVPGRHYVAAHVLFTAELPGRGPLNWRALVEVQTGTVLLLRGLFAGLTTGAVFPVDPVSAQGDPNLSHQTPVARLNPLRTGVELARLTPPSGGTQELTGAFASLTNPSAPRAAAGPGGATFDYAVNTREFAAVNAYVHCDRFFDLMRRLGFDLATYFDGTALPVAVEHWAGTLVASAQMNGASTGVGCASIAFGTLAAGSAVGMATDARVAAHEFGHVVLIDSIHSATLDFAHSLGDSLAAVHFDPVSQGPSGVTFPWVPRLASGAEERRHDRPVAKGWSWGGSHDSWKFPYEQEQILSSTLFRLYQALGGEARRREDRRWASDYVVYLLLYAAGTLPPQATTPTSVEDFATALMSADQATVRFRGVAGGFAHKVVRWTFEKQGLYRDPNAVYTNTAGSPPDVDVYIDGSRGGEYGYVADLPSSADVWNRRQADGALGHEEPQSGAVNYLYVRVRNRGTQAASGVRVRGHQPARPAYDASNPVWPHDWQPLATPEVAHAGPIPPGGEQVTGPFSWVPAVEGEEVLFDVSADGDASIIDPASLAPCKAGPIPVAYLLRGDNNVARRQM